MATSESIASELITALSTAIKDGNIAEAKAKLILVFDNLSGLNDAIKKLTDEKDELKKECIALDGKLQQATKSNQRKALGEGKNEEAFKLAESSSKDQFIHWLECLSIQLEKAADWDKWGTILKGVKLMKD